MSKKNNLEFLEDSFDLDEFREEFIKGKYNRFVKIHSILLKWISFLCAAVSFVTGLLVYVALNFLIEYLRLYF